MTVPRPDQGADYERDWEMTAKGLANENERLKYAVRLLEHELPDDWADVAVNEGRSWLVALVKEVIDDAE